MEVLFCIVYISLCVGFGTGMVSGYVLALCILCRNSRRFDRAVETGRVSSFEVCQESSSTSGYRAGAICGVSTYLTSFSSVYHSRSDCGKLKAAKTVGKFLPCMECGHNKPSMFFQDRVPQAVKRK